jgi:hypothetical protein
MAWRIVKQPNGRYARFSEVIDNFTDVDMSRADALEMCCDEYMMKLEDAEKKVQQADDSGRRRYVESLEVIEMIYGQDVAFEMARLTQEQVQ